MSYKQSVIADQLAKEIQTVEFKIMGKKSVALRDKRSSAKFCAALFRFFSFWPCPYKVREISCFSTMGLPTN